MTKSFFGAVLAALFVYSLDAEGALRSEAFELRAAMESETLFVVMSPARTGIVTTNDYDDSRIWGSRHSEHSVGAIGTGVTIGDYDADGRPDVFIVSKVEPGRLFRNLGDWRFEDVTERAGVLDDSGEWKQGAAFADVNNDGLLDLYVCRFDAANQLYVNQGDGTFREEAGERGLAVVDASGMANFADYDRDGWLDVYLQTNLKDAVASIEGQRDYLFRNRGDGTFEDVSESAGILEQVTQGHSATWWDQNQDGWPDLYVANDFALKDFLYRNNGDGTFTNVIDQALPHTPFSSMGSDIGDVDNDGRIDFFVADMAGTTYEKTQRGLADSRARMPDFHNYQLDKAIQVHSNALFLNTGTKRSLEAAYLAGVQATDWTWSPRFEDLDQDGRLDLFVTNGMDREHNNLDFIVKKLRAVNVRQRIGLAKISPVHREANLAYVNRGDLTFEEVGAEWGLDKVGVSFGSALGDFDGDGDLDIVVANFEEGPTVLRNEGSNGGSVVVALKGTLSNRFGVGARVELTTASGMQVRELTLARGYLSSSEPILHFGVGNADSVVLLKILWPSGVVQTFFDLEVGHRYTVTEGEGGVPSDQSVVDVDFAPLFRDASSLFEQAIVQREEEREGTVSQPLLPRYFNRRGPGIAIADLDGDEIDEVVVAATAVDGVKVLKWSGSSYQELDTGQLGAVPPINDGPPLVFDANGDGANDLLFTAGGAALPAEEPEYEPRLWLNQGKGRFEKAPSGFLPSAPISVGAAVAADFDRDGSLDLFLGGRIYPGYYPEPCSSVLFIQRRDGFEDVTRSVAPELGEIGLVTSALASDVDADGWLDLVLCLEWGGVRVFKNLKGQKFEDVSKLWGFDSAGIGLWTSLVSADLNGDGLFDYVLGNQGLNTIYSTGQDGAVHLFSGMFGPGYEPQLVLAFEREGELYPFASRGELAAKIPEVKKRFPKNDDFAAATLVDVLGAESLAKATRYQANELRSGILLSDGSGRYSFEPLPRLAQIAPVQGLVTSDFNRDGLADVLLVHNDYSAISAHGRFDGGLGLLLLGDGKGGLLAQSIMESGWSVAGNSKALAVLDMDGDASPDVVVTRNNDALLAWTNEGVGVGKGVAVRLLGKEGNHAGIGARVILNIEDGRSQVAEVQAGGGWASQSSAVLFFALPEGGRGTVKVLWPSGLESSIDVDWEFGYVQIKE